MPGTVPSTNSRIRLDPMTNIYHLRAYTQPGDPAAPLASDMRSFVIIGTVVIAGHIAVVSATKGDLPGAEVWADFDKEMLARGVTEVHWERHKNGKTLIKKRLLKEVKN